MKYVIIFSIFVFFTTTQAELIVNGSFETGDYTGWTLLEDSGIANAGIFGVVADGTVIDNATQVFDFFDGQNFNSGDPNLAAGKVFNATDGNFVGVHFQNGPENHRMFQDRTIDNINTQLSFDLSYAGNGTPFDENQQFIAINVRDVVSDEIIETVFKTTDGIDPEEIELTNFDFDLSAFVGQQVRIDFEFQIQQNFLGLSFDNIRLSSGAVPEPSTYFIIITMLAIFFIHRYFFSKKIIIPVSDCNN